MSDPKTETPPLFAQTPEWKRFEEMRKKAYDRFMKAITPPNVEYDRSTKAAREKYNKEIQPHKADYNLALAEAYRDYQESIGRPAELTIKHPEKQDPQPWHGRVRHPER